MSAREERWAWAVICPAHGIVEDHETEPEGVQLCSYVSGGVLCPRRCTVERVLAAEVPDLPMAEPGTSEADAPEVLSPVEVARQFRQTMMGRR